MSQERPPALIDGEKAHEMWKAILSGYEGKFCKDPVDGAPAFSGKDIDGHAFRADIVEYDSWVSIGCEYLEDCMGHYGVGRRANTLAEVRSVIESIAKAFKMKRKEFEQLRLW